MFFPCSRMWKNIYGSRRTEEISGVSHMVLVLHGTFVIYKLIGLQQKVFTNMLLLAEFHCCIQVVCLINIY